jgi:hypothetical protein
MDVSNEEKAKRNHVVPAEMLLLGMKGVITDEKEAEFLRDFAGSFVLASEDDVALLKAFLVRVGADKNVKNVAASKVIGAARC